ncbi:MAG: bis-aminopropyl spermidine synthase family protein, partial [Stackebrandtia sp.]
HTPINEATVVLVGDDDLASVALLRHHPPRRLIVVDLDARILAAVAAETDRLGLADRLEMHHTDLTFPNNVDAVAEIVGPVADAVVTDPPYASDGMAAFVGLATRLTAYDGAVHIACPHLIAEAWSDELLYGVQRQLTDAGFVIERLVPGAFSYETSDVISSLVVARRLPGTTLPTPAAAVPETGARFYTQRTPAGPVPATVFTKQLGETDD